MELGLKLAIDGRARLRTVRNSQKIIRLDPFSAGEQEESGRKSSTGGRPSLACRTTEEEIATLEKGDHDENGRD